METEADPPAIVLDFGEAVRILMVALKIEPTARSAFTARVRQLQRMGLLKREGARAYERFRYGVPELALLATAFRMMSAFMLPILAVRYLTERSKDIVPALVAALDEEDARNRFRGETSARVPILTIEGIALSRLGQKTASDSRYDGPLGKVVAASENAKLASVLGETMTDSVMIDARSFMPSLVREVRMLDYVSNEQIADDVDRLRFMAI